MCSNLPAGTARSYTCPIRARFHDRDAIGWVATSASISSEVISDGSTRGEALWDAPAHYPVGWLYDHGAIFATHNTIEMALVLNLAPYFTSVESWESNGMAETFVKS